jgi:GTP-binding protein
LDDDKVTEIADLVEGGQKVLLAQGGRGGLGNYHFKTSTNRAPRQFQEGEIGEEKWIWLKLKLIADIGLVGMPNAGKSSFISAVTNAKAKIEDYPFTTLTPQLGMVKLGNREMVIADIPGIIEDAHIGKGLGDRFLAHIERCSALLHIIDASQEDPMKNYQIIRNELNLYKHSLANKPEIIVLYKSDIVSSKLLNSLKKEFKTLGDVFVISAVTKKGCKELIAYIGRPKDCIKNHLSTVHL